MRTKTFSVIARNFEKNQINQIKHFQFFSVLKPNFNLIFSNVKNSSNSSQKFELFERQPQK